MDDGVVVGRSAVVLGAGSAGLRHATVLRNLGIDTQLLSRRSNSDELRQRMASKRGWDDVELIVVATESSSHAQVLLDIANSSFNGQILVEKPGIVSEGDLSSLSRINIRVAYNLRYLEGLAFIESAVSSEMPLTASIVCRSNLSDWRAEWDRPGQYSRTKSLGGGVLFDLSHELDYFLRLFGEPDVLKGIGGRLGRVTLDSDDSWKLLASYENGPAVSLDLSYLSHLGERTFVIQQADRTISLDLITGKGMDSNSGVLTFNSISSTHQLMLRDWANNGGSALPDLKENMTTLNFIHRIRALSSEQGLHHE